MDSIKEEAVGQITSGLEPNALAQKTIDFVYRQLPAWRDDPSRTNEKAENKLNLQLCKFLNTTRIRNDFPMVHFEHEEYQSWPTSVDISASPNESATIGAVTYTIYDPIVVLEGKRLPAPSHDREKEYVTGGKQYQGGGIQRFKLGLHSPHQNLAAIIGYIQDGSSPAWHSHINEWILELSKGTLADVCAWSNTEVLKTLEEDPTNGIATCHSTHYRNGNAQGAILIRHLWVKMSN